MQIAEDRWQADLDEVRIEIRRAARQDAPAVQRFFEGLSEETRRLRYHSPIPVVRSWMVDAVVANDHQKREALLALHEGRIIGVAEWGRETPDASVAHTAVVVDDAFRRRGVAAELMRHLAADARQHGIEAFEASVLQVNRPTIGLIQHVAPQRATTFDGPVLQVTMPLSA